MRIKAPGFRLGAANAVAFSASGRLLGQVGRRVAIYSTRDRRVITRSDWHYPHAAHVAFGATDEWFAVRSTTGAIAVMSCDDGLPRDRLPPPADYADDSPLRSAPDDHLVEACSSGTLRVRRLQGLGVEYVEQHPHCMLGPIDASSDLRRWILAVNSRQRDAPTRPTCRLELRDWPFATTGRRVLRDDLGVITAVALNERSNAVAVLHQRHAGREWSIALISLTTGATALERTHSAWQSGKGFTWSADATHLVVGTNTGHQLLNAELTIVGQLEGKYASDAQFAPDGALLALGYWGHGLVLPTAEVRAWFAASSAAV